MKARLKKCHFGAKISHQLLKADVLVLYFGLEHPMATARAWKWEERYILTLTKRQELWFLREL